MAKGFFFLGTEPNIGTTIVTGGIAGGLCKLGNNAGVFAPVSVNARANTSDNRKISSSVRTLMEISNCNDEISVVNPYSFELPQIPSISSKFAGETISIEKIYEAFFNLSLQREIICIDGNAGLMTPINENETTADVILYLNAELIIVSKISPMFVSDVLTTVYLAKQLGISIAGYIVVGWMAEAASTFDYDQIETIKNLVDISIIGQLPWFECKDFLVPENKEMLIDEIIQNFSLDVFTETSYE